MSNARSLFTDAIEDHLALKKQNAALNDSMPLEAFDVGDPLDRFPGGPVKPALGMMAEESTQPEAPTALAAAASSAMQSAFDAPLQPLNGMTPMLSLVEDVDDTADDVAPSIALTDGDGALAAPITPMQQQMPVADVVRFPGGAGPRDTFIDTHDAAEEATGEHPVIVIDAEEPFTNDDAHAMPVEPRSVTEGRIKRPTFFGLRRKRKAQDDDPTGDGWLNNSPRDFNWDN
jgi:hypothetical protein